MTTRDHAYRMLAWRLRQAGIAGAELDARLLVQAVTGASDIEMIREPGKLITQEESALLAIYERRRLGREPVSKILGRREFWGLTFMVNQATLDPRPDSETLVETGLKYLRGKISPSICDLGTGSGCLLLSLLSVRQDAHGLGLDVSSHAIDVARQNAERLQLEQRADFKIGDWIEMAPASFDLVVSNPPYIASDQIDRLDDEVRLFDPLMALDGGTDGLEAYASLAQLLPRIMAPHGFAVIELGAGQLEAVRHLFTLHGFEIAEAANDLAGIARALVVFRVNGLKGLAEA